MLRSIFTAVLIYLCDSLIAQDSTSISGVVKDAHNQPLPGITLWLKGTHLDTFSEEDGRFYIKNIPSGSYTLLCSGTGYTPQPIIVNIEVGQNLILDVYMDEDVHQLDEVVIKEKTEAQALNESALAVKVIDTKDDKQKTADLGEVLSRSEGVSVRRGGGLGSDMRFSLNGLTDDQIRFFVDGIPLEYSPYSLGLANIPVNLVKRLEIYKGVLPIQFGADALGGGVNVVSNPVKLGLGANFSYQTGAFKTQRATMDISYSRKKTFVRVNGFYDFSANNYKVNVQVPNELGKLEDVTVRRFHDDYRAHGTNITVGMINKKHIDEISLTLFYNDLYKEVQHNNVMSGSPYGFVYRKRNSVGTTGKANFNLSEKLTIQNSFGYSRNEREFTDTSANIFNWFGDIVVRRNSNVLGEIQASNKSQLFLWDKNYFWRNVTSYQLDKNLKLSLSIAPTYNIRTGDELFAGTWDVANTESKLLTWVNSLAMNYKKARWENSLFIKNYLQQGTAEEPLPADLGSKTVNRKEYRWGAGNVFIYKVSKKIWLKPSYEYAIRLPRPDEIFGDGAFTSDNLKLKPESSHNVNVQAEYENGNSRAEWSLQSNIFGRVINDLILLIPNNDRSAVYENVFSANSYGMELGAKAKLLRTKLKIAANTTLQHFYNNSTQGVFTRFNGDRIPNRPFYFANASADYAFKNIFNKNNQILLFWQLRYTYEYFLTWETLGSKSSKGVIPSQTLQSAGISYTHFIGKNVFTLSSEIQNLTNQKTFDFYGVQRPGRAVFIKIITQF